MVGCVETNRSGKTTTIRHRNVKDFKIEFHTHDNCARFLGEPYERIRLHEQCKQVTIRIKAWRTAPLLGVSKHFVVFSPRMTNKQLHILLKRQSIKRLPLAPHIKLFPRPLSHAAVQYKRSIIVRIVKALCQKCKAQAYCSSYSYSSTTPVRQSDGYERIAIS